MAERVEQNIVQFEISVNNVLVVEKANRANDLSRIEPATRLCELALLLDVKHQVAAGAILHYKKQIALKKGKLVRAVLEAKFEGGG